MSAEAGRDAVLRVATNLGRGLVVIFFLYVFLVGISLIEAGISSMGAGFQARLLEEVSNPLSGLAVGILITVLVQSSSVSTSTIVGMVGSGALPLELAVPMVMGANIGTTITSTLAALASIRRSEEFRRAFSAATIHDFFNLFGVVILLPLELTTGVLSRAAAALTEVFRDTSISGSTSTTGDGSAIRDAVQVPVDWIERLIGNVPGHGIIYLILALAFIFLALIAITTNMRKIVASGVERVLNTLIGRGGGLIGILVGIGVTVAVQSSSITTSILVPLVASGVLSLYSAFPITVGANIGTTVTAIIASLAVVRPEGLTIALVHFLFNVFAMAFIFPVRQIRMIPIRLAQGLADLAIRNRMYVAGYVFTVFLIVPIMLVFLLD